MFVQLLLDDSGILPESFFIINVYVGITCYKKK